MVFSSEFSKVFGEVSKVFLGFLMFFDRFSKVF